MKSSEKSLLIELLQQQTEDRAEPAISDARLREAITTGSGFSLAEQKLLWLSPLTRMRYLAIRRERKAELLAWCQAQHFDLELLPQAASGHDGEIEYQAEDDSFSVRLIHQPKQSLPWLVRVQLNRHLAQQLRRQWLRLVDSGDKEWCRAQADRRGVIEFAMNAADAPDQRLGQHRLRLEIL